MRKAAGDFMARLLVVSRPVISTRLAQKKAHFLTISL